MLNQDWRSRINADGPRFERIKRFYSKNKIGDYVFVGSIDDLKPEDKGDIDLLLERYYVTKSGSGPSLRQNTYTKIPMLAKILKQIDAAKVGPRSQEAEDWEIENRKQWNPQDRADYEEEMARRNIETSYISVRDRVRRGEVDLAEKSEITPDVNIGRYWISNSGQVLSPDADKHHSEWIMNHIELLDDREKVMVQKYKDTPKKFTEMLFADGWIRISRYVVQMHHEYDMPKLATFLKSRSNLNVDWKLTIIFTKDGREESMSIKDIISKYDPLPDDDEFKLISNNINLVRISSRDNAVEDMIKYTKKYIKPKSKDNKAAKEMVEYTKLYRDTADSKGK